MGVREASGVSGGGGWRKCGDDGGVSDADGATLDADAVFVEVGWPT